jgi:hypothetical protein
MSRGDGEEKDKAQSLALQIVFSACCVLACGLIPYCVYRGGRSGLKKKKGAIEGAFVEPPVVKAERLYPSRDSEGIELADREEVKEADRAAYSSSDEESDDDSFDDEPRAPARRRSSANKGAPERRSSRRPSSDRQADIIESVRVDDSDASNASDDSDDEEPRAIPTGFMEPPVVTRAESPVDTGPQTVSFDHLPESPPQTARRASSPLVTPQPKAHVASRRASAAGDQTTFI